jgi:molybdopterin-guanine dinucleotide biosynthesis protein A
LDRKAIVTQPYTLHDDRQIQPKRGIFAALLCAFEHFGTHWAKIDACDIRPQKRR